MSGLRMLACGNRADNSLRSHVILKQKLLKITYNYYINVNEMFLTYNIMFHAYAIVQV